MARMVHCIKLGREADLSPEADAFRRAVIAAAASGTV